MLYSKYSKRVTRIAAARSFLRKYRLIILIAVCVIVATVATLLGTRGIISENGFKTSFEYGDELNFNASAFMSDVEYEFSADGRSGWTKERPTRAGKYFVRAVSTRSFGGKSYGEIHAFTIMPKTTRIDVASVTLYGEDPEITVELAFGDRVDNCEFAYTDITKQTTFVNVVLDTVRIVSQDGEDVTSSYTLRNDRSAITFIQREIKLTVTDAVSVYDGKPFSSGAWELTSGELASGDVIVPVFDKSLTDVGEIDNTAEISVTHKILNGDGLDVTANYNIDITPGKLTVKKRDVVIVTEDAEKFYDGKPLSCDKYSVSEQTPLADGNRLEVVLSANQTDAGDIENILAFKVYDSEDGDVTANYAITVDPGTLTVKPREIQITTASPDAWTYDGNSHSDGGYTIVSGDFVLDHKLKVTGSTDIVNVGTAQNVLTYDVVDGNGDSVASNYEIFQNFGTLEVTKRHVTVTTASPDAWKYDGKSHSDIGWEVTSDLGFINSATLKVTGYTEITDYGTKDNVLEFEFVGAFDLDDFDESDNYELKFEWGTLKVLRREIEVVTASPEAWVYDDAYHFDEGFDVYGDGLADGQELIITSNTRLRDVGTQDNVLDGKIECDGDDVKRNYKIDWTYGTLEITARPVTITPVSATKEYDGDAYDQMADGNISFTCDSGTDKGLISGHTVSLEFVVPTDVDAGKYTVSIDEDSVAINRASSDDDLSTDVTRNYVITCSTNTLEITPRKVTVETATREFPYDGQRHCAAEDGSYRITSGSMVEGHSLEVDNVVYVTNVTRKDGATDGEVLSVDNDLTFNVVGTKQSNYDITVTAGKLTVTPATLEITSADNSWTYDGDKHSDKGYTITKGTVYVGTESVSKFTEITDYGTKDNELALSVKSGNTDLTGNYDFVWTLGTLAIEKRVVTVTTGSASREYNGAALSSDSYTAVTTATDGKPAIIAADISKPKVINQTSITDVAVDENGNAVGVENRFEINFVTGKAVNYDVKYNYGELKLTKRNVTVTTGSDSKVYDGTPLTCDSTTYSAPGILAADFDSPQITELPSLTNVIYDETQAGGIGALENIYEIRLKASKKNNYVLTYVYGWLEVTPRSVKLRAVGAEKVYDGTPLTYNDYEPLDVDNVYYFNIAPNQSATVACNGSRTRVGYGNNVIVNESLTVKDARGTDVTANYRVVYDFTAARLTVTKREIAVTTATSEHEYDGEYYFDEGFTVTSTLKLASGQFLRVIGNTKIKNVIDGLTDNVLTYSVVNGFGSDIDTADEGGKFIDNYDITDVLGTIEITPRTIMIETATDEWDYDGAEHWNSDWNETSGSHGFIGDDIDYLWGSDCTRVVDVKRDAEGKVTYYDNILSFDWLGDETSRLNYDITVVAGELTIYPIAVLVRTETYVKVYDGLPIQLTGWYDWDGLLDGQTLDCESTATPITEVLESGAENSVVAVRVWVTATGEDVYIGNYEFEYKFGTQIIQPRILEITTASNSWEYDGIWHYDNGFTPDTLPIVDGQKLYITDWAKIKDPGEIPNEFQAEVRDGDGNDKSSNYKFAFTNGTLTVTEKQGGGDPDDGDGDGDGDGEGGNGPGKPGDNPGGNGSPLLKVYSEKSGVVYLRQKSYGAYTGKVAQTTADEFDWDDAAEYTGQKLNVGGVNYSVNYLPSLLLKNSGMSVSSVDVELMYGSVYSLPYYLGFDGTEVQSSDTLYSKVTTDKKYTVGYYDYDYVSNGGAALTASSFGMYANVEKQYREYVYANYLDMFDSTRQYMNGIIAARGFKRDDPDVLSKVARYIQTAAKYDTDYDLAINDEDDVAVAFLDKYKSGVCVHYATAATVLFRALGFPARYTTGFMVKLKAGEWTEVKEGHAWVEVYVDGAGWVKVEVTGSSSDGGEGGDEGEGEGGGPGGNDKTVLNIKPVDVSREYIFGVALVAPDEVEDVNADGTLSELIASGYTYTVKVVGSRVDIGVTDSYIKEGSFVIYDPDGENVTEDFVVRCETGIVWVTKKQISVYAPTYSKEYNGEYVAFIALMPDEDDLSWRYCYDWDPVDGVARVDIDFSMYAGMVDVGTVEGLQLSKIIEDLGAVHVYSESGEDLTDNYTVVFKSGGLNVGKRLLKIKTDDATKPYDGTPLTCEEYSIKQGSLADGHTMEIVFDGSAVDIGDPVKNTIADIKIYDEDGNDVTANYEIWVACGSLTVTP